LPLLFSYSPQILLILNRRAWRNNGLEVFSTGEEHWDEDEEVCKVHYLN
jgi:hypothetical protein